VADILDAAYSFSLRQLGGLLAKSLRDTATAGAHANELSTRCHALADEIEAVIDALSESNKKE
jgi:hypothetical protein